MLLLESPPLFFVILFVTMCFEWCSCVSSGRRRLDDTEENVPEGDLKYHVSRSWNVSHKFGQISAVAIDSENHVVIFHRGPHIWNDSTFVDYNYAGNKKSPIREETIYELDPITGQEIRKWGDSLFFLPHGLSIDSEGNYWITDVAMHQVFKFGPGRERNPLLVLGKAFTPGTSVDHFCQPTSVAVHSVTKEIFVADGYCNSRLMKFSPNGRYLMAWGEAGSPRLTDKLRLAIPHKVVLAEDHDKACVSDRENGLIKCFETRNAAAAPIVFRQDDWVRLFSISYAKCAPVDMLFAVTGPSDSGSSIEAYAVGYNEMKVFTHFAPHRPDRKDLSFSQPHDIVASKDCKNIYIVEIGPNLVWKFMTGFFGPNPDQKNTSLIPGNAGQANSGSVHSQYFGSFTVMISASSLVIILIFLLYRRSRQARYGFSVNFLRRGMSNSRDSFDLGRLLEDPQKSGFNRVSTHDTDADMDGDQGSDSEVEEFNVSNVRINGLKV